MKLKVLSRNILLTGLCGCMLLTGCNTWNGMSQTGQGATAGGAIGAAVGTGVGALIGGGKGTWIGALVGSALGAGTGALVGNSMQKQKESLQRDLDQMQEQINQNKTGIADNKAAIDALKVETVKDDNGLEALKLVMGDAILFPTNSSTLSAEADAVLSRVAYNLKQYPDTDVAIVGFTDNTGSDAINNPLSLKRAQSVMNQLEADGVAASRLKAIGQGSSHPIAPNNTAAGRAQNRRVEMYIYASKQMIENAQNK